MKINETETVDRDATLWCPVAKAVDDDDQAGHRMERRDLIAGTLLVVIGLHSSVRAVHSVSLGRLCRMMHHHMLDAIEHEYVLGRLLAAPASPNGHTKIKR